MNIYKSKPASNVKLKPGQLHFEEGKLLAGCKDGAIEIITLQLPGTKKLTGKDFANGYDVNISLQ
jgi:methionyl-tRNA formyltransferase